MSTFKHKDCLIPTVWCGDGKKPHTKKGDDSRYYRKGTRYECMKKGIGVGMAISKESSLPKDSIQRIKYIGEKHSKSFSKVSIHTTTQLLAYSRAHTKEELHVFLSTVLKRKTKGLDKRAYNSVLMYLHTSGIQKRRLPGCHILPVD